MLVTPLRNNTRITTDVHNPGPTCLDIHDGPFPWTVGKLSSKDSKMMIGNLYKRFPVMKSAGCVMEV